MDHISQDHCAAAESEAESPLDRVIRLVGSATKLAAILGVTKSAVSQWKHEDRKVPAEHCPEIERLCNGAVRCEELNDKVDWAVVRESHRSAEPR
ncbi:MAG: transcriptional regulator [Janthinobacterium lividum]